MEFHEIANIFPLIQGEEFRDLVSDIGEHGLLQPIWVYEGKVLDGRNRFLALQELGLELEEDQCIEWVPGLAGDTPLAFVLSMNMHRRHLTKSQLAMVATDMLPFLEREARKRMLAGVASDPTEKIPGGESREIAAKLVGVNPRYVSDAKAIKEADPELAEEVRAGIQSLAKAKRVFNRRDRAENPPLPVDGKYRVIYADPPWSYGNSGVMGDERDSYTKANTHYATMTLGELCDMGSEVRELSEKDAVLFLWVTSPLLEECFEVIRSWGFKYKTSFVWDKVLHNFGHYNSVRHEMLLICTRGTCTPDVPELIDSVQELERDGSHSEKPEHFREIIDRLYVNGNRIELFARKSVPAWDAWGDQV